jgi:hypothetical protein
MAAQLNHTIVWSSDQTKSARFLAEMLGRSAPTRFGHFDVVNFDNGVSLDFANAEGPIRRQHYAFLISEADFDAVLGRIRQRGLDHWADPMHRRPGETTASRTSLMKSTRLLLADTAGDLRIAHAAPPIQHSRTTGSAIVRAPEMRRSSRAAATPAGQAGLPEAPTSFSAVSGKAEFDVAIARGSAAAVNIKARRSVIGKSRAS